MIKHINKTKHDFFLGEWKVKRSISDKMNSKFFSFFGEATLVEDLRLNIKNDTIYVWEEKGKLLVEDEYLIAKNKYIWKKDEKFWKVYFFDKNNFFYHFDVFKISQDFSHKCKKDNYFGKKIIGNDRFILEWRVIGPKKNMFINSIFYR